MGIFIRIEVDKNRITLETAQRLAALCPVDIFSAEHQQLTVLSEQEDECTLCGLCLDAAPTEALTIQKLYKNETLVSRG